MYKIGLTGGIASGKSTAADWLRARGVQLIDADQIARQVVEPGMPGLANITACFGPSVLTGDGQLDREALGRIVFSSHEAREKLNGLLHELIHQEIDRRTEALTQSGVKAAVYDVPLLVETGWYKDMDEVWLVYVEPAVQLDRLMSRNGLSKEEASQRIASQMPLLDKKQYSHVIINNNGDRAELEGQLERVWGEKKKLFE